MKLFPEKVCENCAHFSPSCRGCDPWWDDDCYGFEIDTAEDEELFEKHFYKGEPGCPHFKLRSELRLKERVFSFYYEWREERYWRKVMERDD